MGSNRQGLGREDIGISAKYPPCITLFWLPDNTPSDGAAQPLEAP
ncbi:hypothetical protein FLM9_213 [Candidatus Synechococcus spongiarum]|uniref:Uncharacterized protein n=1 Tax=Candidatus Synechococcus spongiarum TaxID=431041 RepID=A0A164Z357_9SYNE|nr:hypothetical protein FLM9_213 [Candidatus Synechococcus spongiarum]